MLYVLEHGKKLSPVSYLSLVDLKKLEKDLENLLANNLFDVLFEDSPLMPIFQERQMQAEADIYALDEKGNLIIFELKRDIACGEAALQVLRYAQDAGLWTYGQLNDRFNKYIASKGESAKDLSLSHSEAFGLDEQIKPSQFNRNQKLYVVGNAANISLIQGVDYWKSKGIDIDFIPYRLYKIENKTYFEFFSKPYDIHENELVTKAVLFDTNRSYDENSIWEMFDKKRVSAYGNVAYCADYLHKGDMVFYSHKGYGIVAVAIVKGKTKTTSNNGEQEKYHDVDFLTPVPESYDDLKYIPFSKVSELTGKSFYWARTIKVPYLTIDEGKLLIEVLNKVYSV
jgi:hypothetical protein